MTIFADDLAGIPPYAQGLLGTGTIAVVATVVWVVRKGWLARETIKGQLRKERLENATDEYNLDKQRLELVNLETAQDKSLADIWREQFDVVKKMWAAEFATWTAERGALNTRVSQLEAQNAVQAQENARCSALTAALTAEKNLAEGKLALVVRALKTKGGIDLDLDWLVDPKAVIPLHAPSTTTVNVNMDGGASHGGT